MTALLTPLGNATRHFTAALAFILTGSLDAQSTALTRADSALIVRVLLAEDRRDSADSALAEAGRHGDARVRSMAERARGRIRDPKFASRTSLPALPAPPAYPDPAWRIRFRALTARGDCGALRTAVADSAWPVRLRAADLTGVRGGACTSDAGLAATFVQWVDQLPSDASRRSTGSVSWHGAAHGIVALARIDPAAARARMTRLATHQQWHVRVYAARAAAVLSDTTTLRTLAVDRDDNVRETAIGSLRTLTGHTDDALYLAALKSKGAQAVQAAARALKGSGHPGARIALEKTFEQWVKRNNAPARDARVALLDAAGRLATDDRPPPLRTEAPRDLAALALGADIRLRVTMSPKSGGGSFVVRLRGDNAPMMAARILALAGKKYFDGLTWHRVEHDFVIQGGSPGATEYIGYKDFFRDELGIVPHARGTVGMSTRGHDTGDAQWFVNLRDNLRLNTDYTIFAEVIEGIDVVDGVLEGDVIESIRVVGR